MGLVGGWLVGSCHVLSLFVKGKRRGRSMARVETKTFRFSVFSPFLPAFVCFAFLFLRVKGGCGMGGVSADKVL